MVHLSETMKHYEEDMPSEVATVSSKIWQRELKPVDIKIRWQGHEGEQEFFQHTHIHRATAKH